MRSFRGLALALVAGCGSSYGSGDATTSGVDGGTADGGTTDAGTDAAAPAPSCLDRPFTNVAYYPQPINQGGTPTYSGWLSPDGLSILFCSNRETNPDLYWATRADAKAAWGTPSFVNVSTQTAYECDGAMTSDTNTIYFASDRGGGVGGRDIWTATRATAGSDFAAARDLATISSANDESAPWPTPSGTLWFQSNRGGVDRIWSARPSQATGDFVAPAEVVELNDGASNGTPVVTDDEKTVYFASTRNGNATDWDVWMARRGSATERFGPATLVKELSSDKADYPVWVSSDGCRIVVETYGRPGEGAAQIFYAERK